MLRPSSRANNATVVSGGISAIAGARCCSTSASFQRSTPSTMITRRPIANVIALSASATPAGVARLAVEHLDARGVPLPLGQRPQPRAALGDRAVVVAVDQVGGLQLGHRPSLCAEPTG